MTRAQALEALERTCKEAIELRAQVRALEARLSGAEAGPQPAREDQIRHRLAHALGRPDLDLDELLGHAKRMASSLRAIQDRGGELRLALDQLRQVACPASGP